MQDPKPQYPFVDSVGQPVNITRLHRGADCFLLLCGPSLATLDLSLLRRRGAFIFAANNAASLVRPHAVTHADPPWRIHDSIWRDPAILKFTPHHHLEKPTRQKMPSGEFRFNPDAQPRTMPGVVGICRNQYFSPACWLTEPTINWGNGQTAASGNGHPYCKSVMFQALKIIWLLGFHRVFLLGCDFTMDETRPYGFNEQKTALEANTANRIYEKLAAMFRLLAPYFESVDFRIFNCNPESRLTVFPSMSYSEAIERATGTLEQEPLDCRGYYTLG